MVLVWYVIQVINGREDVMRERIERMVPASSMQELFYPQYQTEIKVHGEWISTTKPLLALRLQARIARMPVASAGCVRAGQVISKLDRTQTAEGMLRIGIQTINCIMQLHQCN